MTTRQSGLARLGLAHLRTCVFAPQSLQAEFFALSDAHRCALHLPQRDGDLLIKLAHRHAGKPVFQKLCATLVPLK